MKPIYLFFGGKAGHEITSVDKFETAKHTKGDAHGKKGKRAAIKVVPQSRFTKIETTTALVQRLFDLKEPANREPFDPCDAATDETEAEDGIS